VIGLGGGEKGRTRAEGEGEGESKWEEEAGDTVYLNLPLSRQASLVLQQSVSCASGLSFSWG
jgi:hypothetical protein